MDNGAQPHSGTFYLGKVQVGRPIGQVLTDHSMTDRRFVGPHSTYHRGASTRTSTAGSVSQIARLALPFLG